MPSRKKKSKAKGRKPVAAKGGANKAADNVQQRGTLDSEMQRLKIGEQQGDEDDVEAMLEEAIKLAAVEEKEMKAKEKENCKHGYKPSSMFEARFCEDYLKTFMESYYASRREGLGLGRGDNRVGSAIDAFCTTLDRDTTGALRNKSNVERVNSYCVAEGTKFILDLNNDDARLCGVLAILTKSVAEVESAPDRQKIIELIDGDEHTLVQFFRKQIPCSCLDEKYKEVKSITKMGICFNEDCPLPGHMAVRSKMLRCTGCLNGRAVNYCSRECQEANWPMHKIHCGKTTQELAAMRSNE
jgi:hypothetical protein